MSNWCLGALGYTQALTLIPGQLIAQATVRKERSVTSSGEDAQTGGCQGVQDCLKMAR